MDTLSSFAKGEANRNKDLKVFDWDKAAKIIKEGNHKNASAGLAEDMYWTAGNIFVDGEMPDSIFKPYLASTWATPVLIIDDDEFDCYKMQSETDGWNSDTFWPDSAREIMGFASQENAK